MGSEASTGARDGHRRGLIVDYGGVLTSSPFLSFQRFCTTEGLDENAILTRVRADAEARELVYALETGELPELEFESRFATMLGVEPERLINRLFAHYEPDERMLAAVARARAGGIRTGLLSNSWGTRRYDRGQLAVLFDGVVISGEVGMRKPAPEIYALGAERAGLTPADCVFVDDMPVNLDVPAELGMATVLHVNADETIAELEALLGVSLA
jgi:putative hydrolase of the HAD superfamily